MLASDSQTGVMLRRLLPRADRTRRKASQAAQLAAIVDSSDDAIISQTLEGQITSWNQAAEQIYGYSAAEALEANESLLLAPGGEDARASVLARVAGGERLRNLQTTRRRKDGGLVDVSITVSPIRDAHDRVIGVSTIARDITERKRVERELARLADAVEHGTDAVVSIDLDVCHWNPGAEQLFGWSAEEALGRSPLRPASVHRRSFRPGRADAGRRAYLPVRDHSPT